MFIYNFFCDTFDFAIVLHKHQIEIKDIHLAMYIYLSAYFICIVSTEWL